EVLERDLEPVLRLSGRERWELRLRPDDKLELRDEIDHQPRVLPERIEELALPLRERLRRLGQNLQDKLAQRLNDGRKRRVPRDLVELASDEVAAPVRGELVSLVHQRRFPDAGIPRDEA